MVTRRGVLKAGLGMLGAAAGGASPLLQERDLKNFENPLKQIARFKESFDADKSFQTRVAEKKKDSAGKEQTDPERIRQTFLAYQPRKGGMPIAVRDRLAVVAPGIVAQESRYNPGVKGSRAAAQGIWQIVPSTLQTMNAQREIRNTETNEKTPQFTYDDIKKDITVGAFAACIYFDYILYEEIKPSIERCASLFALSSTERDDLTTLCLLNAYNVGGRREAQVINDFSNAHNAFTISNKHFPKSPLNLFALMAHSVRQRAGVRGYGVESAEYVPKVLAGAESIGPEYRLLASARTDASGLVDLDRGVQNIAKPAVMAAVGGTIGALLGGVTPDTSGEEPVVTERRRALKLTLLAAFGITGNQILQNSRKLSSFARWLESKPPEKKVERAPQSDLVPMLDELEKGGGLFQKKIVPSVILPRANFESAGVASMMRELLTSYRPLALSDLQGKKFSGKSKLPAPQLDAVDEMNDYWRCTGLGQGNSASQKNDAVYLKAHAEALPVLTDIGRRFQNALSKYGIHKDWTFLLEITSLVRPTDANRELRGASRVSPHLLGLGIDFSKTRITVKHKPSNRTQELTADDPRARIAIRILREVLAAVHTETKQPGTAIVTDEFNPAHFHVTAVPRMPKAVAPKKK